MEKLKLFKEELIQRLELLKEKRQTDINLGRIAELQLIIVRIQNIIIQMDK
jgi:hypothetical protein